MNKHVRHLYLLFILISMALPVVVTSQDTDHGRVVSTASVRSCDYGSLVIDGATTEMRLESNGWLVQQGHDVGKLSIGSICSTHYAWAGWLAGMGKADQELQAQEDY